MENLDKTLLVEDIVSIKEADYKYQISFKDGNCIRVKEKLSIVPVLFLLKYEVVTGRDFDGEKYDKILSLVGDKAESGLLDRTVFAKVWGFRDLYDFDGYEFILRRYHRGEVYFQLLPEDRKKLLQENFFIPYETSEYGRIDDLNNQKYNCIMCDKPVSLSEGVQDMIIPLMRGGEDDKTNIQLLCKDCYKHKRDICKDCIRVCNNINCPISKKIYLE